jgi:hypothetical protein
MRMEVEKRFGDEGDQEEKGEESGEINREPPSGSQAIRANEK